MDSPRSSDENSQRALGRGLCRVRSRVHIVGAGQWFDVAPPDSTPAGSVAAMEEHSENLQCAVRPGNGGNAVSLGPCETRSGIESVSHG